MPALALKEPAQAHSTLEYLCVCATTSLGPTACLALTCFLDYTSP